MRRADGKRIHDVRHAAPGQAPILALHYGHHSKPSLCQWPGCEYYAATEIKEGLVNPWIALCGPHRKEYTGFDQHEWQPRRRRYTADMLD